MWNLPKYNNIFKWANRQKLINDWISNMNIAFIPIRSGSKAIPNKNIRSFIGEPLLYWTIKQAKLSKFVDNVVVSTDSYEYADLAKKYGASVPYIRAKGLATDDATTESVMLDYIAKFDIQNSNNIVLLQCTSPIRRANLIDDFIQNYTTNASDSSLSVVMDKSFTWQNPQHPFADYDHLNRPRRQDINENNFKYRETGSMYVTNVGSFKETQNRLCGRISLFETSLVESFEIDETDDWNVLESLAQNLLEYCRENG